MSPLVSPTVSIPTQHDTQNDSCIQAKVKKVAEAIFTVKEPPNVKKLYR
jgi:hypothetical protein